MKPGAMITVIASIGLLASVSQASSQSMKALSKDEIKAACRQEVEAVNPHGSLSTKRQSRNALINECITRRKTAR
ncbi:hypothetical protein [Microvirga antarctica]|uniref:hypothetical protein n=1 Tax=Microvirga antarctica TaxID=2819233 RepID=UPI001B30FAC2|nr:hypothetical protein [Microvirga antarctica]